MYCNKAPNLPAIKVNVKGKFNGKKLIMLVDTGSVLTLVSGRKARQSKLNVIKSHFNPMIRGASGKQLNTPGIIQGPIKIGATECNVPVIVCEDLTCDLILGADALTQLGAVIDLANGKMKLAKGHVPLCLEYQQHPAQLTLEQNMIIPPRHQVAFNVGMQGDYKGMAMVQSSKNFIEKTGLLCAHVIVDTQDNCNVPVVVMNASDRAVSLYSGQVIGDLVPVENCVTLVDQPSLENEIGVNVLSSTSQSRVVSDVIESLSHLSLFDKQRVKNTFHKYQNIFSTGPNDIGRTDRIFHVIDTGDSPPIKQRFRRLPVHRQEHVEKLVDEMLQGGYVRPSNSPWASPIVLVKKKDGSTRFCVDYRQVNLKSRKDAYPLPRMDDALELLHGAQYFSTIDLASGYWQIEMEKSSIEKTAFTTHKGLYEFTVMPFGLTGATGSFQRLMDCVLSGLLWKSCLVYLDDVIVFSKTFEEHQEHLEQVFGALAEANLKIKPSKCRFFEEQVVYLGHTLTRAGITTEDVKVEKIKQWPTPRNLHDVRSFLGLANYYRTFVPGFSDIAEPLISLTEKGISFVWTGECETAFVSLKEKLSSPPVLAYPDFSCEFILDTDASNVGMGAVLSQVQNGKEVVIAYGSKKFNRAQRNYSVTRREMNALVYFCLYFKKYLLGRKFKVRVDHSSLKWMFGIKEPEGQVARWLESLADFDFEPEYRPGKLHANADAMSRHPCLINWIGSLDLKAEQSKDKRISKIRGWLSQSSIRPEWSELQPGDRDLRSLWSQWNSLVILEGVLYRSVQEENGELQYQVLLPFHLRSEVLEMLHDHKSGGGHLGISKTFYKVKARYYWPGYRHDVAMWCLKCTECASKKGPAKRPRAPLKTVISGFPMERMAMDILGPLPMTRHDNKYILVVEDYFTKWVEAFPLPDQEACTIASVLVESVFSRWGVPLYLHSDQGKNFESVLMKEVCSILGIEKTRTTAYHPMSDGLVERYNRTLTAMLSHYVKENQTDWDDQLQQVMLAYRTSVQESTGFTPHFLWTGREVQLPIDLMFGKVEDSVRGDLGKFAWDLKKRLHYSYELAREHLYKSHNRQKECFDRNQRFSKIEQGDKVGVFFPNLTTGRTKKLAKLWKGPYTVTRKINDLNYEVVSSTKSRCSRIIVHFNRLMKWPEERVFSDIDNEQSDESSPVVPNVRRSIRVKKMPVKFQDYRW